VNKSHLDSRQGSPPYFDRLLQRLASADAEVQAAFGQHVHWGYWSDPTRASLSVKEYGHAAEALCQEVLSIANVTDGLSVLDVGCGLGGTIACLNAQYRRLNLFGVNIDEHQLQYAEAQIQARADNTVRLIVSDAAQLPFADESIDLALAVESVFHFDRPRFFSEIGRVLCLNGSLTLSDFVPEARVVPYIEMMDLGDNTAVRSTYGVIDISWSIDRYRCLAAEHGLTLSDVHDVTAHTLPTYDFLRKTAGEWNNAVDAKQFMRATALLEEASRRGFIGYQILRFVKQ
jgi:SAM-dependent methyltransferase